MTVCQEVQQVGALAAHLTVHILTADTFGTVQGQVAGWPCRVEVIPRNREAEAKVSYIQSLGADKTAAVGNGRNDRLMLKDAGLGIVVI